MPSRVLRVAIAFLLGSAACSRAPSSLAPVSTARPSMVRLDPSEVSVVDREQNADQQVLHVLNRLAFGPRPGDVARVREIGVDAWMAQQLAPMAIDDERAERFDARFAAMRASPADLMEQFPPPALVRQQLQRRVGADSAPSAADSQRVREMQRLRIGKSGICAWITKMFMPTGGCIKPSSITTTSITPNQIGS